MNIDDYKKAMQDLYVDTDKIINRLEKTKDKKMNKASYYKKFVFVCVMSTVFIIMILSLDVFNNTNASDYNLRVYASSYDKEEVLSNVPVTLITSRQFNMLGVMNEGKDDETGRINFDLNFRCEGENIKNITYKLSDKIISCDNMNAYDTWFAESAQYDTTDNLMNKDKSVYRIMRNCVTKMVGSSYTVDYESQNEKNYLLEIRLKSKDGKLTADNFTITVIITLNDGITIKKHILVHPLKYKISDYKLNKIEMTLLN